MAGAVAGQTWRVSSAAQVETDLAALWREVAHDEAVSRAVMSNLVVFCRCSSVALPDAAARLGIDAVVERHPARVVILVHDFDAAADPERQEPVLETRVGVVTYGPPGSRYGVEQIVIRSACNEAAMRSVVRRLVLGDVPTSIWWTEDLSATRPLAPLVAMSRQFLYDSRTWTDVRAALLALAPLLANTHTPDLADLNWRRLSPVRHAIRHGLASRPGGEPGGPLRIRFRHGEEAVAWLLAAWARTSSVDPPVEDVHMAGDVLIASLDDGFVLRMSDDHIFVADPLGPAPFTVTLRREDRAESVAGELRVLTRDTALQDALRVLVEHFEHFRAA